MLYISIANKLNGNILGHLPNERKVSLGRRAFQAQLRKAGLVWHRLETPRRPKRREADVAPIGQKSWRNKYSYFVPQICVVELKTYL